MCKYSTTAVVVRNIKHYFYRHLNPQDSEYLIDVAIVDSDMFDFNANKYGEAFISDESEQALITSIGPRQISDFIAYVCFIFTNVKQQYINELRVNLLILKMAVTIF